MADIALQKTITAADIESFAFPSHLGRRRMLRGLPLARYANELAAGNAEV
jgi:hypothetical protein